MPIMWPRHGPRGNTCSNNSFFVAYVFYLAMVSVLLFISEVHAYKLRIYFPVSCSLPSNGCMIHAEGNKPIYP
jgi:hypothetical protein